MNLEALDIDKQELNNPHLFLNVLNNSKTKK